MGRIQLTAFWVQSYNARFAFGKNLRILLNEE